MNKDTVIIPLRVSREQRRLWKVDAAQRGISVQGMLMERLEGLGYKAPVIAQKPAQEASSKVESGEVAEDLPRCCRCKQKFSGRVVYTKDKKPLCGDCADELANAIA